MRNTTRRLAITATTVVASLALTLTPAAAGGPQADSVQGSQLAATATELITNLDAIGWPAERAYNYYGTPSRVTLGTPNQPTTYLNVSQCATFVRRLMSHRFAWATSSWFTAEFGDSFPDSAEFHDAFAADLDRTDDIPDIRGFELHVFPYFNLEAGDIMAIRYDDGSSGGSGHMAIIGTGSHLVDDTHPSYREWAIRVMDSTSSPHGVPAAGHDFPDTRFYLDPQTGRWTEADGAGAGWMFIRTARADGAIISHSWSADDDTWHTVADRPINFGRIDLYA
ncbi:hypothetical protein ACFQY4_16750 [Catellatospora bangladeshensis]|uniref:Amidase domain-containing protein n=1 Tax=Catellatospora bangladeshensis TaxID=310355 RepID=A0A8J3NKA9_9ACTN|nr:hypothetical protein [Catellatospora bangladeshensis]GIF84235.1 hypothetical protein Cba03nite_55840 [Catellatospora bangladeshensis]